MACKACVIDRSIELLFELQDYDDSRYESDCPFRSVRDNLKNMKGDEFTISLLIKIMNEKCPECDNDKA